MTDDPASPPPVVSDDQIAPQHPLILASRIEGTPVFNKSGDRIGHLSDITLEKVSGRAIYGILSFGGFLGIGASYHPVPWAMLTYDPAQGGFVVPLDKAELDAAPHYDRSDLEKLGGESNRDVEEAMYTYYARYGISPYW